MTGKSLRSLLQVAWRKRFSDWLRFAVSLTQNEADAEDLVDEAVVRTLRAEPDLKSESDVHGYILTAIRNTSNKWARAREQRHSLLLELRNQGQEPASSALQELIEAELQAQIDDAVERALEKMPAENREAFGLYITEDPRLTLKEIAERQKTSRTTAHRRVQAVLRVIADKLEGFDQ